MKIRFLHYIRENFKFFIWNYVDKVHNILRIMGIIVSFFTMGIIAYYYGFPQTESSKLSCEILIHCSLIFYILKYLISAVFSIHTKNYLRKNMVEGFVILIIIIWFIFQYIFSPLHLFSISTNDFKDFSNTTIILVQIYFFFMMIFEIPDLGRIYRRYHFGPRGWMVCSFLLLIGAGTALLMLPEMTENGISFIDALFTATSASDMTGISVVETASFFTFKGQFVILLLMQLGGLNIICFATFLSTSYKKNDIHSQSIMQKIMNTNFSELKTILKTTLVFALLVEFIGFCLFFFYWNNNNFYSNSVSRNVFLSAFHSIAAFSNAGFSIIEDGMQNPLYANDYYIQIITIIIFTFGNIGFLTIHDLMTNIVHRNRGKSFWKKLKITSRISLGVSGVLILIGSICFFIFERNGVCEGGNICDRIMKSVFMASSSRSAGFSTIDVTSLSLPTLLILICLMFIGTAPTSTGGGIKVTTFYILIKSAIATMRGNKEVTISNRAVPGKLVDKATTILILSLGLVILSTLIISLSNPQFRLEQILFEVTSAISNVGLSINISSSMSFIGKLTLVTLMFIGRITILTLAISVTRKVSQSYSLVKTNLSVQ